ncbi:MAG: TonB-dependent hemoglobin/transferrin/lactoferrin family receptor [Rhizobiaceae bacterium]|nr:TonB-dependent hemoglobin/transferrin/lactoferrin family receptor [Rhizobiaceae bacterium]
MGSRARLEGMTSLLLAGVAGTVLAASPAIAQNISGPQTAKEDNVSVPDDGTVTVLDEILVSSRTGDTSIETLGSASHVDQEQIERRMSSTPSDVLFGVPGVTVNADARKLSSSVNIRGLQDFGRVAVIVDGARQNFQRSDHGPQSTFWIDPELIQSVDVVRGPVSNTFGSGAIGGIVFFDTKDPEDFLKPDEHWAVSSTAMYDSAGDGLTTSATGAYRFNDSLSVLGNVVYRDYGDYEAGSGAGRVPGTGFDVLSGMLKATIRPTENSELKLGWIGSDDGWSEISGGQPAYNLDLQQNTFTGRYNITDDARSWLDLHVNVSHNATEMEQTSLVPLGGRFDPVTGQPMVLPAGAKANYDIGTTAIDLWNTSRFQTGELQHELTYGADWVGDKVDTTGTAGGDAFYTPSGDRTVWGAYIQDKVTWNWLEVVGGLRYDDYKLDGDDTDASGDHLSPRISVGISPFTSAGLQGLQFFGTYAEGYRSPSLSETLISGLHPAGVSFPFLPNPNLNPETGKTWEFGVNYRADSVFAAGDALRVKAAYFNNDVDDYIDGVTLSAYDPTSGCYRSGSIPICFQYQNFARAKIEGFELESLYDAAWGFAGLSVSLIDGHTVSYDGERADLATTPASQVTAQLGFRFLEDRLTVGGEVQYNGKPKGSQYADDYTLVNAFASYRHNDNLKFDLRVDNILDEKYVNPLNATSAESLYEPGVSVKVAARLRFGG